MPDLDGLELQRALTASAGSHRPVVFITGKGDIPTSVRAMKAGAIDFLTKPVKDKDLFEAISLAEAKDTQSRRLQSELKSIQAKIETLTPREREVPGTCRRRAPQQADSRRSGHRREDHQGSPQPDDGEAGHSHRGRSRSHGRETRSFEVGKSTCWPKGQLDG
jgi:YesN/AraC family two-component response regulator